MKFNELYSLLMNEGWYDDDEIKTISITLEDMILVKESIDKSLEDISKNRKSKTSENIEVWKVDDKYLIVDGWHRFVEASLENKKTFTVNVIGDGYSNTYVTNFDSDKLYTIRDFISTIDEWKD